MLPSSYVQRSVWSFVCLCLYQKGYIRFLVVGTSKRLSVSHESRAGMTLARARSRYLKGHFAVFVSVINDQRLVV